MYIVLFRESCTGYRVLVQEQQGVYDLHAGVYRTIQGETFRFTKPLYLKLTLGCTCCILACYSYLLDVLIAVDLTRVSYVSKVQGVACYAVAVDFVA